MSLLVAVRIGGSPVAHKICLVECSGNLATTAHSHHHDAQGPDHQMAGHSMDGSHAAMMGNHREPAAVTGMARATQCCASVVATPRCCRSQDASDLLVPTMKLALDSPQTTVAHAIADVSPPVSHHSASFVDAVIRPPVPLARLTPLRI
jgi:hypothetical protein